MIIISKIISYISKRIPRQIVGGSWPPMLMQGGITPTLWNETDANQLRKVSNYKGDNCELTLTRGENNYAHNILLKTCMSINKMGDNPDAFSKSLQIVMDVRQINALKDWSDKNVWCVKMDCKGSQEKMTARRQEKRRHDIFISSVTRKTVSLTTYDR